MASNNAINGAVKVTTYTASDTWTKNARAQWIKVYIWGAGQGGGSGRKATSTTSGGGGGGGGGGSLNGTNSGAGGNGGAGKIVVVEFLA